MAGSWRAPRQAEAFLAACGRELRSAPAPDLEDFLADPLARRSASTAATPHKGLRILYRWLAEEMRSRHSMARIRTPIPTASGRGTAP